MTAYTQEEIIERHNEDLHDDTSVLQVSAEERKMCILCNSVVEEVKTIDLTPPNSWVFNTVRRRYSENAAHARQLFFAAYPSLTEKYFTACIKGKYTVKEDGNVDVDLDD